MVNSIELLVGGLARQVWSNRTQAELKLDEPAQGLILLFHGFPDNNETWLPVLDLLCQKFPNWLILAPQLIGYELCTTGRPTAAYSLDRVAEDFVLWTQFANGGPVHLVGHDWGACAAYRVLAQNPTLFASVTTLAIPHCVFGGLAPALVKVPKQIWFSSYMLTMNLPFVYRPRITQNAPIPYIRDLWAYWSPGYTPSKEEFASVCNTLHLPGVVDSATAYYRNLHRVLKRSEWKVDWTNLLVLAGNQDGCMAAELFEIDQANHPGHVEILQGVGHFMQRENPELVAGRIANHISGHSLS